MKKLFLSILTIFVISMAGYAQSEILLDEPFSKSLGSFTLDEQKYPNCSYSSMWYVDVNYGYAKVTANKGGQSLGASDCKLISPVLNTEGYMQVVLRFDHTTYAGNSTSDVNYCLVKVSKDGKNWTKLTLPTWPTKRWGFVTCELDLTTYASSTMQFMFEYISTSSYAGTWEVKNVVVEALASPENYCPYEELEGLTSNDLRSTLHGDISQHTMLSYNQIRGDKAKVDVRSNGKIWDIYSAYSYNLSDYCSGVDIVEGECYNREHILPKSWWGGSTTEPMYTDLHHVYSVDAMANDKRSAWIYDEVKSASWSNNLGSQLGTSANWSGETAFEPVDEYKGDIARIYFYMLTCYMDKDFTVGGKELTTYLADVDTDAAFTPDTEAVENGVFTESTKRSAPYFDVRIDGIKLLNEKY